MVSWLIAGLGLLLAVLALLAVRRLSRRLDSLNQSYWELRYDYTRLRSRLSRLDPEEAPSGSAQADADPSTGAGQSAQGSSSVTFVPLSTIRKKEH